MFDWGQNEEPLNIDYMSKYQGFFIISSEEPRNQCQECGILENAIEWTLTWGSTLS